MKVVTAVAGVGLVGAALAVLPMGVVRAEAADEPQSTQSPGAVERAAMAKVDFLVGDWEGEGWAVRRTGEKVRFWVKEFYHYRGDKDLLDMEGRFGDVLADGTRTAETEYDLGILYYDRQDDQYHMWHYSSSGEVFTTPMEVDIPTREMEYTKEYPGGMVGRFHLVVGADGVWTSKFEILQPDKTWRQVMEFRMERVKE